MTYFSYGHSILSYGIIFWGNSSHIVIVFSKFRKGKLGLLWVLVGGNLAMSC
jgi:hypothetical protein